MEVRNEMKTERDLLITGLLFVVVLNMILVFIGVPRVLAYFNATAAVVAAFAAGVVSMT